MSAATKYELASIVLQLHHKFTVTDFTLAMLPLSLKLSTQKTRHHMISFHVLKPSYVCDIIPFISSYLYNTSLLANFHLSQRECKHECGRHGRRVLHSFSHKNGFQSPWDKYSQFGQEKERSEFGFKGCLVLWE